MAWVRAHNGKQWVNLDNAKSIKIEESDLGQPKRYTIAAEYCEYDGDYPVLLHETSSLEAAIEWVSRLLK